MLKIQIKKYLILGIIYSVVLVLTIGLTNITFLNNIEHKIHDSFFIIRNNVQPQLVPQDIIIVAIDEASFQELKIQWPWPRRIHSQLIDNLVEGGARIIAFDIVFADPTDPDNDKALRDSIERANNVILANNLEIAEDRFILKKHLVQPLDEFVSSSLDVGLANVFPDQDNFVRRTSLSIEGGYIFAYQVAKRYLGKKILEYPEKPIIINYLGPTGSMRTVSYYQALDYKNYLPKDIFKDKIAIIGLLLEASPDLTTKSLDTFATPFFTTSRSRMFGVEIQANIIYTLLKNIQIKELTFLEVFFILLVLLILSGILVWPNKPVKGLILNLIFLIIYIIGCTLLFLVKRIFMPVLFPFLQTTLVYIGTMLYKYLIVEKVSLYDPLTSLFNRRNLELQLERTVRLAKRHGYLLSLAMTDIDHFKKVNDTYGHQVGDIVLKMVSHIYKTNLKKGDIVGRYGGEEFTIILPHTDIDKARDIVERLREIVASTRIEQVPAGVTVSFGVASLGPEDTGKSLMKKADELLYKAKETGRNRVVAE